MSLIFVEPEEDSLPHVRGFEEFDDITSLILVRMPVELVSQALAQIKQPIEWQQNAYEQQIQIAPQSCIVYQFDRHVWTTIQLVTGRIFSERKAAKSLSALLDTKTIYFHISDISLEIGYNFYNCGELAEYFFFRHEEPEDEEEEIDEDEEADDVYPGIRYFQSQLRETSQEIRDPYHFVDSFLRKQDAYVPKLITNVNVGEQIILRFDNLKFQNLIRMDYISNVS